jgi:hypothetical protein
MQADVYARSFFFGRQLLGLSPQALSRHSMTGAKQRGCTRLGRRRLALGERSAKSAGIHLEMMKALAAGAIGDPFMQFSAESADPNGQNCTRKSLFAIAMVSIVFGLFRHVPPLDTYAGRGPFGCVASVRRLFSARSLVRNIAAELPIATCHSDSGNSNLLHEKSYSQSSRSCSRNPRLWKNFALSSR